MIIRCINICIDNSMIITKLKKKKKKKIIFFLVEIYWFWTLNMVDAIYININYLILII
jgi:hypothetical protein